MPSKPRTTWLFWLSLFIWLVLVYLALVSGLIFLLFDPPKLINYIIMINFSPESWSSLHNSAVALTADALLVLFAATGIYSVKSIFTFFKGEK